ncbi:hypothetical protein MNBD_GAMMA26-861 [hydrothermal vent metagenome]|uniref:Uncharacterized protein n=1 Tax=hydrothermal vent metagenome TaxID=652676 RepID=A0A3B1BAD0_9ZZZZ
MKKSIGVLLGVCIAVTAGYFAYQIVNIEGSDKVVQTYIKAMKERDFGTLATINHRPQKQANIIARAPKNEQEGLLKKMYEGYRQSFEAMQPSNNTTVTWAEKFYFVPGMDYQIIRVEEERSPGSTPSSDYRYRSVASVIITVSYPTLDISPEYNGRKIRAATLQINLVQSRDVVKGMQGKPVREGWLFKWFMVDGGSVVYWDS